MSQGETQRLLDQATADFADGRFEDAVVGFRSIIAQHPDVPELHINLGAALKACNEFSEAEIAYRDALKLAPENALAWFNLGNLLSTLNRREEALAALRKANLHQPGTPEILNNLGVALYDLGHISEALTHYDAALAVRVDFADAQTNRGNALQRLCRMDDAEIALQSALDTEPDNPVFRLNMSAFMAANGETGDAIEWAKRALEADPAYVDAELKLASLLIQSGDLAAGFAAYEARWKKPNWHALPNRLSMPVWDGSDIQEKHILVWNEQGFGDALLYARYLPILVKQCAKVSLMCETPLVRLMEYSFGDIVDVISLESTPPQTDLHVSIMSLPHLLGTTLQTIPAGVPYLQAMPDDIDKWRERLAQHSKGNSSVGLIWAGNPGQAHDYSRSMAPEDISSLLDNENFCFLNLLVGPRGDQWKDDRLIDLRSEISDFADTAALMAVLDLVISVDSGPTHLAGALGRPTWIMLSFDPDSRYFLNSDQSPWYPTARLFRQAAPGNWTSVAENVSSALDGYLSIKAKS